MVNMNQSLWKVRNTFGFVVLWEGFQVHCMLLWEIRAEHKNIHNGKGKKRKRDDGDEPPAKKAGATKITAIELD